MTEITRDQLEEISLLSIDAYSAAKGLIPLLPTWWWLRTPGAYNNQTAYVFADGDVYQDGFYVNKPAGVRPAFKLAWSAAADLNPGDKVQVGQFTGTVIYDDYVLLDKIVGKHIFDTESNQWRRSAVKQYMESDEFLSLIFDKKES